MKHIVAVAVVLLLPSQNIFAQQEIPTQLNLVVVSGEGALTRTGERVSQPPSVRVEDQNNKPVTGAAVVFTLPASGPGGVFDNNSRTQTVVTDDNGVATVRTMRLNDTPGRFQILVNVAYRGITASTAVTQFSTAPNGPTHTGVGNAGGGKTKWIILAIIGGGAAAGAAVAAGHGSSSSSSGGGSGGGGGGGSGATITITVGSSTVTHP
jgi:hypothetical protein